MCHDIKKNWREFPFQQYQHNYHILAPITTRSIILAYNCFKTWDNWIIAILQHFAIRWRIHNVRLLALSHDIHVISSLSYPHPCGLSSSMKIHSWKLFLSFPIETYLSFHLTPYMRLHVWWSFLQHVVAINVIVCHIL